MVQFETSSWYAASSVTRGADIGVGKPFMSMRVSKSLLLLLLICKTEFLYGGEAFVSVTFLMRELQPDFRFVPFETDIYGHSIEKLVKHSAMAV